MKLRPSEWFLLVAVIAFFVTGALFYPHLPPQIASHWGANGEVNGTMSRTAGVIIFPIIFTILALIFFLIPRIDPRRENIAKFRTYYDWFVTVFAVALYYIYILTLIWNVESAATGGAGGLAAGGPFDLSLAILPPIAALLYIGGMILPRTHPNWFIGVRTPWTISSPTVWQKTNAAGGWVFRAVGIIALAGIFFPPIVAIWFLLVPILVSAIGLVVYSYVLYERERK